MGRVLHPAHHADWRTAAVHPGPFRFFTWIISLLTLVAVLAPFMTDATLATQVATAAIGLVIGLAIGSLVFRNGQERDPARQAEPAASER